MWHKKKFKEKGNTEKHNFVDPFLSLDRSNGLEQSGRSQEDKTMFDGYVIESSRTPYNKL